MPLDLLQLRAFSVVAKAGSLGRGAAELNLTQPAVSRTIKRLEDQLGVVLFERHAKGMQLTEVGRTLMPRAEMLLHEADVTVEEVHALRSLGKGVIRVGAVASIACVALPQAIERVTTRWPNLRVHAVEGVDDQLTGALLRHEIDIVLGVMAPDTEDIVSIKDFSWSDVTRIVASPNHPLARKRKASLADTLSCRWAMPPAGTRPYRHMESLFAAHGLPMPAVTVETFSVLAMRQLVMHSGYLSWQNEPMFDVERRAGLIQALPIPEAAAGRLLTAFKRRGGLLPRPAQVLLDELRAIASRP